MKVKPCWLIDITYHLIGFFIVISGLWGSILNNQHWLTHRLLQLKAINELLALPEPPDAIFAYNDAAALVVQRICTERGLRIPEDIALVGFDDIDSAAWASPPLTTIAIDKQQLGREAVMLLLADKQEENKLFPVQLIKRGSTEI